MTRSKPFICSAPWAMFAARRYNFSASATLPVNLDCSARVWRSLASWGSSAPKFFSSSTSTLRTKAITCPVSGKYAAEASKRARAFWGFESGSLSASAIRSAAAFFLSTAVPCCQSPRNWLEARLRAASSCAVPGGSPCGSAYPRRPGSAKARTRTSAVRDSRCDNRLRCN